VRIQHDSLHHERKEESIAREAALDGVHVIRSDVPEKELSAEVGTSRSGCWAGDDACPLPAGFIQVVAVNGLRGGVGEDDHAGMPLDGLESTDGSRNRGRGPCLGRWSGLVQAMSVRTNASRRFQRALFQHRMHPTWQKRPGPEALPSHARCGLAKGAGKMLREWRDRLRALHRWISPGDGRATGAPQPSQLPHSSAVSGGSAPLVRSCQRTISHPLCSATARNGGLGLTTTGCPSASKRGMSAAESE